MEPDSFTASLMLTLAESQSADLGALQLTLLAIMPLLLLGSAFFSGSETALFGLTAGERLELRRISGSGPRAALSLLHEPRLLLILLLLGNMSMNVLYFVVSSVLMMNNIFGWFGDIIFAITALLAIVVLGELVPKFIANGDRIRFARSMGPTLYAIHRGLLPFWKAIDGCIVTPLSRLTKPNTQPPALSGEELQALVELSGREGVLDANEQVLLGDVLRIGRTTVHQVMTPRTRMRSLPIDSTVEQVRELVRQTKHSRLPVHGESLDNIMGMLHVKEYLQRAVHEQPSVRNSIVDPVYIPEVTTLDKVLDHFRSTNTQSAIVVDEYGGTAGLITLGNIISALVGDIGPDSTKVVDPPRSVGPEQWSVDGNLSTASWRPILLPAFGSQIPATVGGLVTRLLGRTAVTGDVAEVSNLRLEVHHVEHDQVARVLLTLVDREPGASP
jgi:putative hemolysin